MVGQLDIAHNRLLQKLELLIGPLDQAARGALFSLPMRHREFAAGTDLVRQGERPTESCFITDGWACRYKIVCGDNRQILSVHFTGDLPDLQGLHLSVLDHGISALTRVRASFIPHRPLLELMHAHNAIADALTRHMLIDGSIFREWLANIGRRPAYERIAHLFCELFTRMRHNGLTEEHSFRLPMTQNELADATSLSTVHVNRVLQRLRRNGLIVSQGSTHAISDWEGLKRAGDFDDAYLHQRPVN